MKLNKLGMILAVTISLMLMSACGSTKVEETVSEPEEIVVEAPEEIEEIAEETGEEIAEQEDSAVAEENSDENSSEEEKDAETQKSNEEPKETEEEIAVNWEDIEELTEPLTMYAQSKVNVRKGPDTTFDIVGSLSVNDEVSVIGKSKSTPWKEIKYKEEIAFVHGGYLGEEQVDLEALKAAQEAAAQAAAEAAQATASTPESQQVAAQQPAPAEAQPAPQPQVEQPAGILFIGDSRTCQMKSATGGAGCSWICEYAQSYDWFESTAVPQADKMIGQGTKVVICMGVNDPNNCNKYASLVNQKAGGWNARGAKIYYVSVNPTAQPYEDKNPSIDNFNANMPGLLSGVTWIDTASTIKQGGYALVDGIHYDTPGNINIFNMICGNLR